MKRFTVTADGVHYLAIRDTKEEAQKVADRLNDEYYRHNTWNVQEVEDDGSTVEEIVRFDEYGRAWCSEDSFFAYIEKTAESDDYTREGEIEGDEVVSYFNAGGCLLARYNRTIGYGETF